MENLTKKQLEEVIDTIRGKWKDSAAEELQKECIEDLLNISEEIAQNNEKYYVKADEIWAEAKPICDKIRFFSY